MKIIKLSHFVLFLMTLFIVACEAEVIKEPSISDQCYYLLDFSGLPDSEDSKLSELSMNIHDNYFMYKNLYAMPLRFNNEIFLSLDCDLQVGALELDDWMREFILDFSEITEINFETYELMFERSTSGIMVVE